jgi:hypothetical protein
MPHSGAPVTTTDATAVWVHIMPASVCHILNEHLQKQIICAKWILYVLNNKQHAIHMSLFATNFHVGKRKETQFLFSFWQWISYRKVCLTHWWSGRLLSDHGRRLHNTVKALWKWCTSYSLLVRGLCLTNCCHLVLPLMMYYSSVLRDKCYLPCIKNNHKCWNMVSLSSTILQHFITIITRKTYCKPSTVKPWHIILISQTYRHFICASLNW